jgi:hypothetical protein
MGAAASGVIIGIIRIVTKGSLPQTASGLRTSTQIYFAASACITAACVGLYELLMPRLDVTQHYRGKLQGECDCTAAYWDLRGSCCLLKQHTVLIE